MLKAPATPKNAQSHQRLQSAKRLAKNIMSHEKNNVLAHKQFHDSSSIIASTNSMTK